MSEKEPEKNVIRSIFELLVLLLALGVIFGGLAVIIFPFPRSKTILVRRVDYDICFSIELLASPAIATIIFLLLGPTVLVKNIVHSALYLLGTFAGVAALYIFMNAPFVGVAQILVYIGAVGVLILFAVMLTRRTIMEESHGEI